MSPEERELARRVLLERLTAEPSGAMRKSVMGLVGVLARHAVPRGEWPGLLGHLAGCAGSADEGHRAAALGLFQLLAEDAGDSLRAHFGALAAVLGAGLRDPAPAVRAPAARAVAGLVPHCVERGDAPHVRDMVRGCVEAARRAAQRRSARLCVHDGDDVHPVLRMWEDGFALALKEAPILHGFAAGSLITASLDRMPDQTGGAVDSIDVRFIRPMVLPAKLSLELAEDESGQHLRLLDGKGKPCVVGTFRAGS